MGRVRVFTSVDVDDVLEEINNETIFRVAKERGQSVIADLLDELKRADLGDYLTIAERFLEPKWHCVYTCHNQYVLEMGR